jgi:hypothetical protein
MVLSTVVEKILASPIFTNLKSRGSHLYLFLNPRARKCLIPYLISLNLFEVTKKLFACSSTFEVYTLYFWNFCILK